MPGLFVGVPAYRKFKFRLAFGLSAVSMTMFLCVTTTAQFHVATDDNAAHGVAMRAFAARAWRKAAGRTRQDRPILRRNLHFNAYLISTRAGPRWPESSWLLINSIHLGHRKWNSFIELSVSLLSFMKALKIFFKRQPRKCVWLPVLYR